MNGRPSREQAISSPTALAEACDSMITRSPTPAPTPSSTARVVVGQTLELPIRHGLQPALGIWLEYGRVIRRQSSRRQQSVVKHVILADSGVGIIAYQRPITGPRHGTTHKYRFWGVRPFLGDG